MLITIDPSNETPLFEQIAAAVRAGIMNSTIQSGDRIPTAKELCASLDVNRNTVLHAYQILRDEGLIELRRGRGATITPHGDRLRQLSASITQLAKEASALGVSADTLSRLVKDAYQ